MPDPSKEDSTKQQEIIGEEPYQEYNLPDIDTVREMDDKRQAEDTYDKYLGAAVSLPGPGNQNQMANALRRIKGDDGKNKGVHHMNPILNTLECLVEFPDGATKELTENLIAE